MTVEEIEIIVTAKVEEALKEFQKILPEMTKIIKQAQEQLANVDMSKLQKAVKQQMPLFKKQVQNLKKSIENNDISIKINNKDAEKQISQTQKQIDSLQEKINARKLKLDFVKQSANQMYVNNKNDDGTVKENLGENTEYIKLSEQEKELNKEIQTYNKLLEDAKNKMAELKDASNSNETQGPLDNLKEKLEFIKPVISTIKEGFKNLFTGNWYDADPFDLGEAENQIRLIDLKIDKIENKIRDFQSGKITLSDEDVTKAEVELDALYQKREKLENENSLSTDLFQKFSKGISNASTQIGAFFKKFKSGFNIGDSIKSGVKQVAKYALALFSLRGIYSILSNCAQSWLSSQNAQAKQLSANIEYMKYAMGSALAPVIQFVTNLVYQLMKAIQSVAYAMSGVNIFAKATASSMNKTAGSAGKASKSLAGVHNEINNVSDNNGGSGTTSPSIDLSKMDNTPNTITDAIKQGDWNSVGTVIGEKINEAMNKIPWEQIQDAAKSIGKNIADFLNGGIKTIDWNQVGNTFAQGINTVTYLKLSFLEKFDFNELGRSIGDSLNGFIGNVDWKALAGTLSEKIKGIFDTAAGFCETFDWSVVLQGLIDYITGFDWNGVSDAIFKALGSACASLVKLGMVIGQYIRDAFKDISQYFQDKIEECGGNVVLGILKGIGDAVIGIGQWIYDHIFKPFIEGFKNVFGIHSPSTVMAEQGKFIMQGLLNGITSLVNNVKQIWENIKNTAVQKFTEIKNSISNTWQQVIGKTLEAWQSIKNKVKEGAQGAYDGIKSTFSNIPNWFREKFSEAWKAVKNVFSTGGQIFDGIKDGILNGLKAVINAIITGINKVVSIPFNGLNSALRKIRDVNIMGLNPFSWISTIQVPQIPRLAKGNVAYDETLAIFGEYSGASNNPEITTPQNIMRDTFEDVLSNYGGNSNDRPIYLTVNVGNKKLGQILLDDLREKTRRTGKDIEALVGG